MPDKYRVAVFAHNEEHKILAALRSIEQAVPPDADLRAVVLANGCSDRTVPLVLTFMKEHPWVQLALIPLPSKTHAWNLYVHHIADDAPVHFFMDGDCRVSPNGLALMLDVWRQHPHAHAVAGFPLSDRHAFIYQAVMRKARLVFGNLYAIAGAHLERIRMAGVHLPVGTRGEDHLVTRLLWRESFVIEKCDNRLVVYREDAGYVFDSLQPWRLRDWRTFFRRRINYRLRTYHIRALDPLHPRDWPRTTDAINRQILQELDEHPPAAWDWVGRALRRRLRRMYPRPDSAYYEDLLGRFPNYQLITAQTPPSAYELLLES